MFILPQKTGYKVGFKPAGGIRSAKDSLVWMSMMKEELGDDWTRPNLFRIGASSLLTDIERQLFHHVYGRWALDFLSYLLCNNNNHNSNNKRNIYTCISLTSI